MSKLEEQANERWEQIQDARRPYNFALFLGGGLLLVIIGYFLGRQFFSDNLNDYHLSLWSNILSIGLTALVVDQIVRRRDRREEDRKARAELLRQRRQYEIQLRFADSKGELRRLLLEMDQFGLSEGADLARLDLSGVDLAKPPPGTSLDPTRPVAFDRQPGRVNLRKTLLHGTDFTGANLTSVDFSGAIGSGVSFSGANLSHCLLRNVLFFYGGSSNCNFTNADFEDAEFNRFGLSESNFTGANFKGAEFYRGSIGDILPDGRPLPELRSQAEYSDYIRRFTDPKRGDFWRSDDLLSPAYGGRADSSTN